MRLIYFTIFALLFNNLFSQDIIIGGQDNYLTCHSYFYDDGGELGNTGDSVEISSISPSNGECLKISFEEFDLGYSAVLRIYDGNDISTAHLMGTYSGTNLPPELIAHSFTFEYIPPIINTGNLPGWKAFIVCEDCNAKQTRSGHGDCITALPLCNDFTNIGPSTGDLGSVDDEDEATCFEAGYGGTGSIWYTFNAQTAGNLGFDLDPTGATDYDFALFDITNGCENMQYMSCNFSVEQGNTGMTPNSSDYNESHDTWWYEDCNTQPYNYANEDCGVWNETEHVDPTHTYVLLVNFYGGSNDGFTIDFQAFSNTVSIGDQIPPTFANVTQPGCNGSVIDITFSELIDCATLDNSDFSIPGYTVTLGSYSCNNGMTNQISLNVSAPLPAGTYTLSGIDVFDMCGNELDDNFPFTIIEQTLDVTLNGSSFCEGGSTTITTNVTGSGTYTYAWSTGATTSSISVSAAGTYCVTVTDDCSVSDNACITINEDPTPVINVTTTCDGSGNNADLTATGCSGALTWFEWGTVASTIPINNEQECIDCPTANPEYNWIGWYTGCDQSTCATTTTGWSDIGTNNPTTVSTPYASQYMAECVTPAGCSAQEVFVVDCNTPITVTVNSEAICTGDCTDIFATVSGGTSPYTYSWSPSSLFGAGPNNVCPTVNTTYSVTVTDAVGTTETASGTVTVNPLPNIYAGADVSICEGNSTILTASGADTYAWNNSLGTGNPQTVSPTSTTTYTVTGTDVNGCSNTDDVVVNINPNPTPTPTGNDFCTGFSTTLDAGNGYSSYSWDTGGNTQNIIVSTVGTYTVTVTDGNGCIGNGSVTVNENTNPTPNIIGSDFCSGTNTTLDAGSGYNSYSWDPSGSTQTISINNSGTYTVTVTDANGCAGTDDITITENANPTPNIAGLDFCTGDNSNLDAGTSYSSYLWSTTENTQIINVTSGGTYTVTVTDGNGCTGTDDIFITENPLPTPVPTGLDFCEGASSIVDAGAGYVSYSWSTGGTTQTITATATGTYTVTVTNANGCSGVGSVFIKENANPTPTVTGNDFCAGNSTTVSTDAGYVNYAWNSGNNTQSFTVTTGGFYSVTVTDGNGCLGSDDITINENSNPTPTISGSLTFCAGGNTTLDGGNGYTNYNWSTTEITQTINVNTAGTYNLIVTDANGCTGSDQVTTSIASGLSPTITGVLSICSGAATTLDAGAGYANYAWSTTEATQTISVSTGGIYSVTVTDASGCSGSDQVTVAENANPTPAIIGYDFCQGLPTTINADAGYTSYTWSTTETTASIAINTAGTYSVTVVDNNGCQGSDDIDIAQYPLPTPIINGNDFCNGTSELLSTDAGYSGYQWNTTETSQQITINTGGTYSVTVTDANGCEGSASKIINIIPNPTPNIVGNDFCSGTNTTLDAGIGYVSYSWSTSDATQTTSITSSGLYSVSVTDGNGCIGTNDINIAEITNPTPNISGILDVCEGENSALNVSGSYSSYSWSTGVNTQSITVTNTNTYSVTVTDANGCIGSTSINFTQHPLPLPSINGNTAICLGSSSIIDAGAGYSDYLWSTYENTQTISVNTTGIYMVTVTDAYGCTGNASLNISVDNLVIAASGNQTICNGNTVDIAATVITGVAPYTYYWDNGTMSATQTVSPTQETTYSVSVIDGMGCTSNIETITISVTEGVELSVYANTDSVCPGDPILITCNIENGMPPYTLYDEFGNIVYHTHFEYPTQTETLNYTVVDACGSTASDAITINVYPIPPLSFSSDILYGCEPLTVNFTSNSNGNYSYIWNFGSYDENNLSLLQNPQHTYNHWGLYDVGLTITTDKGCKNSLVIENMINVYRLPDAMFEATPDLVSIINPTVQFENFSEWATSYVWNFADGDSSNIVDPSHTFEYIDDYNVELIAISQYGCKDTTHHLIRVEEVFTIYVPTAFTPDNDGINDSFFATGHGIDLDNFNLRVYDRWGELIWETNDLFHKWDGRAKGKTEFVQVGTYTWLVTLKSFTGIEYQKTGSVTVIR